MMEGQLGFSCESARLWWTGRDLNPRPSGVLTVPVFANRTFFGLMFSVYQAELPAHGSAGFGFWFGLILLGWGRRRDVHTLLGWFEPGLQAPLAKALGLCLSGLYATKLRYGGHVAEGCLVGNI